MSIDRWGTLAATAFGTLFLAALPVERAYGVSVAPLPMPGPYAVECSNVLQDFTRLSPGEDAGFYWDGELRADGTPRRPADLLVDPANTPTVTINVPNDHDVFGSFAGRTLSYVVVICHPTSSSNPRSDFSLPTGKSIPHMMRAGDVPLWPDLTTSFPALLFSHGYGGSPISNDYLLALNIFASFGYVVAAPFHTDATFSPVGDLDNIAGILTSYQKFTTLQALRPLTLAATLDLLLAQPQWRDRVDARQIGGFGASMGAESMLLMAGAGLTTTPITQDWTPVMGEPRLKAAVGYVPYFGSFVYPAFGRFEHGLDGVKLSYLAISGLSDTTAPITETLQGIDRLAGPRELVTLTGVRHEFDVPSTADIFTWSVTYLDAEVRKDPVARAKLLSMTSVAGGGDDHVLVPFNGPATVPPTPFNFQGMWWAAPAESESGWGINFAHQSDVIFATWFTHDLNGKAWNLSMTAFQTGPNTFSGTLNLASGPPLGAVPFDPTLVQRMPVGSATLTFADGNNGTFAYTVNGISQTKAITRQVFGVLPTCVWGALGDLTLATNYTDMWWAAGGVESGWGINFTQQLTQQGDIIFATWFTFDSTGAALPMSATLTKVGTNVYSGALIRTSGPPFNAVPFNPDAVIRTPVGMATVTFTNGNAATFSYQVNDGSNSVTQTKSIARQVFRAPGTVCR